MEGPGSTALAVDRVATLGAHITHRLTFNRWSARALPQRCRRWASVPEGADSAAQQLPRHRTLHRLGWATTNGPRSISTWYQGARQAWIERAGTDGGVKHWCVVRREL